MAQIMFDIQNNEIYLHAGYLHAGRQHVHAHHVLGPDAGALHDQLLVAELHPVEAGDGLVRDRPVQILGERVALGQTRGRVLYQIERLQLAETCE